MLFDIILVRSFYLSIIITCILFPIPVSNFYFSNYLYRRYTCSNASIFQDDHQLSDIENRIN